MSGKRKYECGDCVYYLEKECPRGYDHDLILWRGQRPCEQYKSVADQKNDGDSLNINREQEEPDTVSGLTGTVRNIAYYSSLVFGLGYIMTMFGALVSFSEILSKIPSEEMSSIPGVTLFFVFLTILAGMYFGWSITQKSELIRDYGPRIDYISSPISAFSFMILLGGMASITFATFKHFSLFPPIYTVTGAILMLIGFKIYKAKPMESKLIGGILMLASVILVYFFAYVTLRDFYVLIGRNILSASPYGPIISLPPLPGPLSCEANIEAVTLLIATVCAILFAFSSFRKGSRQSILGIVLSTGGILFAIGVLYFNFSALAFLSKILSLPEQQLGSLWMIFFGFLVLGISGITILIVSCLLIVIYIRQSLAQEVRQTLPPPPPPPASEVKVEFENSTPRLKKEKNESAQKTKHASSQQEVRSQS